jgi:hypothetical protein
MPKRKKSIAYHRDVVYKKGHPTSSFLSHCSKCGKPIYVAVSGFVRTYDGRKFHKKCLPKSLRKQ